MPNAWDMDVDVDVDVDVDMDMDRSHQGLAGCRAGGSWPWRCKKRQPRATAEQRRHDWAHLRLSRKKKSREKPLSSAEGIRIYCHIR